MCERPTSLQGSRARWRLEEQEKAEVLLLFSARLNHRGRRDWRTNQSFSVFHHVCVHPSLEMSVRSRVLRRAARSAGCQHTTRHDSCATVFKASVPSDIYALPNLLIAEGVQNLMATAPANQSDTPEDEHFRPPLIREVRNSQAVEGQRATRQMPDRDFFSLSGLFAVIWMTAEERAFRTTRRPPLRVSLLITKSKHSTLSKLFPVPQRKQYGLGLYLVLPVRRCVSSPTLSS